MDGAWHWFCCFKFYVLFVVLLSRLIILTLCLFFFFYSGLNSLLNFQPLETSISIQLSLRSLIIVRRRYIFHSLNFPFFFSFLSKMTFYFWWEDIMLKFHLSVCSMPLHGDIWNYLNIFQVRLIASVPGYHTGTNLKKWGHMKLRTVLQECTFDKEFKKSPLVYQVYLKFFLTGMMIMWQLMVEFDAKRVFCWWRNQMTYRAI